MTTITRAAILTLAMAATPALGMAQSQTSFGPRCPTGLAERVPRQLIAAVTDDLVSGRVLDVRGGPPWTVSTIRPTSGGQLLRRCRNDLYLVNSTAGTIERFTMGVGPGEVFDLGAGSEPQDVWTTGRRPRVRCGRSSEPELAFVTRRYNPVLLGVDLATGEEIDLVDLSPVGAGAPIELGTMIVDGSHLFVQVKVLAQGVEPLDQGILAVVNWRRQTLVDTDPIAAGIQGVALQGAPPRLKMQIIAATRTLFVSATEGTLDGRGAIEMVDLDSLTSIGFALSEREIADLGGFVMTSPDAGYFVFHTDFAASTHLKPFTIQGGSDPNPEIAILLGDEVETLVHDPQLNRLYMPTGAAAGPTGIHVIDTTTNSLVPGGPILTGEQVRDLIGR